MSPCVDAGRACRVFKGKATAGAWGGRRGGAAKRKSWGRGCDVEPETPRESAPLRGSPSAQNPEQRVQSVAGAAGRISESGK